jgi:lauroyl/myristoyl acyltransferase
MRRALARTALNAAATTLGVDASYTVAARLSGTILRDAWPRLERATRVAFPDHDERWIAGAVRDQIRHRAWVALDKRTLPGLAGDELLGCCDGLDRMRRELDAALARGRGAIVYSIHYGRPLLVPALLAHFGYPCTRLRPPRASAEPETILVGTDTTKDEMLGALARNRVLSLLVDTPLSRQTAAVEFLGGRLPVAVGLAYIVRESGASLIAVTSRTAAPFRFRIDASRVELPDETATPEQVGAALLDPFESIVREDAGPWYGANRIFRADETQPTNPANRR